VITFNGTKWRNVFPDGVIYEATAKRRVKQDFVFALQHEDLYKMNSSMRGGMQVHAVPDDERAKDSRGQPLPWAYSYAE